MLSLVGCPGPGGIFFGVLLSGGLARGDFFPWDLLPRGDFVRGCFCPRGLLPGGTFVQGAYVLSPQVQCVYAPSRLSVPSIVA